MYNILYITYIMFYLLHATKITVYFKIFKEKIVQE